MNKGKYTLAIDLGSTEFKAAAYDNSRLLGSAGYKLIYNRDNAKVEFPINNVLKAFSEIIGKTLQAARLRPGDIAAIGIASQAQTFAMLDDDYQSITPFVSWLDMRAAETCGNIKLADFAEHCSINGILPNMQISLLHHMGIVGKVMPLPSYLIRLLTGQFVSDNNIAAMSGLFSLRENKYWQPALKLLNLTEAQLPEIIEVGTIAGQTICNPFNLPEGIPVCSCGNDQTAGAFGAGLLPGDALITLGTAQVVYCCCDKLPQSGSVQFRGHYPGGLYYAMSAENGGAIINRVITEYPEFKDFDTFSKLAEKSSGASDVTFHLTDKPQWSDKNASAGERALAVFVYLADKLKAMLDDMEHIRDFNKIYITGGGTQNKIWLKQLEKALHHQLVKHNTSPCYGISRMLNS